MAPPDTTSTDVQRRFTTLEGYREAGKGIYLVGGSRITAIKLDSKPREFYDSEWGKVDERPDSTRNSRKEQFRLASRALNDTPSSPTSRTPAPGNTFLQPEEARRNLAVGPGDVEIMTNRLPPPASADQAFHIFNKRQKWTVIGIIGMAGLFSGLSSNIYFPSLEAISKVSSISFFPTLYKLPSIFMD